MFTIVKCIGLRETITAEKQFKSNNVQMYVFIIINRVQISLHYSQSKIYFTYLNYMYNKYNIVQNQNEVVKV